MSAHRTLSVSRPVPPVRLVAERFATDPARWLPPPARDRGRGRWEVDLELCGAHRAVVMAIGDPWRVGPHVWRSISWAPWEEDGELIPGPVWLPSFEGTVGLRDNGVGGTELVVHGGYRPPFGAFGLILDRVVAQRLARLSIETLLDELATGLRARGTERDAERQRSRADSLALRSAR